MLSISVNQPFDYKHFKICIAAIGLGFVRSHVSNARMEMHWLPVRERIVFKLTVLTREARRTRQPTYLAELLIDRVAPRLLRSASDNTQLVVPRTRNRRQTHAFSSAAPVVELTA